MKLPPLPTAFDYGYDWIEQLSGGWYVVPVWGKSGWNLGDWPYVIVAHYDGDNQVPYGMATYTEGDITITEYKNGKQRNKATDKWAIWWWKHSENKNAPKSLSDGRLGPYKNYG